MPFPHRRSEAGEQGRECTTSVLTVIHREVRWLGCQLYTFRNLIQVTEILSGKASFQTQICPYCFYCLPWVLSAPRRFGPFSWSIWTVAQSRGLSVLYSKEGLHSFLSRPPKLEPTYFFQRVVQSVKKSCSIYWKKKKISFIGKGMSVAAFVHAVRVFVFSAGYFKSVNMVYHMWVQFSSEMLNQWYS